MAKETKIKIKDDVIDFCEMSFKKFKKKNKGYYEKKELEQAYYEELLLKLPETIYFVLKYGHIKEDEVQERKNEIFGKYADENFLSALSKAIKKERLDEETLDAVKLMPIILKEMLEEINKQNAKTLAEGSSDTLDTTDIVELCRRIFSLSKKKMKKFEKANVDDGIVFDVMCTIPHKSALNAKNCSINYRVKQFYNTLYELAKTKTVPFGTIMDIMVPEEFYTTFIMFALLERKEKFGRLTDSQKTLYSEITTWALNMLNESSKDQIKLVIQTYVNARKKDEANNSDSPRRYPLKQISEVDFGNIDAVIKKMCSEDNTLEKYLL